MMNDLPTVFEVVSGGVKQSRERDRPAPDNSGRNKVSVKVTRICHFFTTSPVSCYDAELPPASPANKRATHGK
jgi:hypothetical protein